MAKQVDAGDLKSPGKSVSVRVRLSIPIHTSSPRGGKTLKVCSECQRVFTPSSDHQKCPSCRRKSSKHRCVRCSNLCGREYEVCFPCSQTGNRKNTKGLFTYYLNSSRNRKYEFDLDEEYLDNLWRKQQGLCALSGVPLSLRSHRSDEELTPYSASLDRIDSTKGYIKGNVQFLAYSLNLAKQSFSNEELKQFLLSVTDSIRNERKSELRTRSTDAASMPPAPPNLYGAVRDSTASM